VVVDLPCFFSHCSAGFNRENANDQILHENISSLASSPADPSFLLASRHCTGLWSFMGPAHGALWYRSILLSCFEASSHQTLEFCGTAGQRIDSNICCVCNHGWSEHLLCVQPQSEIFAHLSPLRPSFKVVLAPFPPISSHYRFFRWATVE
jgi:hypothetical protein